MNEIVKHNRNSKSPISFGVPAAIQKHHQTRGLICLVLRGNIHAVLPLGSWENLAFGEFTVGDLAVRDIGVNDAIGMIVGPDWTHNRKKNQKRVES